LLASVAIGCFFWPVVRDQWIQERALVAGRFDEAGTLRVLFVLWRHHRRIDSYGSPLGPLIVVAFTLCAALAAVTLIPAIFAS
jgi:hypothetical protein